MQSCSLLWDPSINSFALTPSLLLMYIERDSTNVSSGCLSLTLLNFQRLARSQSTQQDHPKTQRFQAVAMSWLMFEAGAVSAIPEAVDFVVVASSGLQSRD